MEILIPFHSLPMDHQPPLSTSPSASYRPPPSPTPTNPSGPSFAQQLLRTPPPPSEERINALASSSKLPPQPTTPTKPRALPPLPSPKSEKRRALAPAPLLIPSSATQPLFSAYPVNSSESGEEEDRTRQDQQATEGDDEMRNRGGSALTPSNPLAHTWGHLPPPRPGIIPGPPPPRPKRRATISTAENDPALRNSSAASSASHSATSENRPEHPTPSTDYPPTAWETRSALPPGAMPAVDPAAKSVYEVFAQDRYGRLGGAVVGSRRPLDPIRVFRIPGRASSLDMTPGRGGNPNGGLQLVGVEAALEQEGHDPEYDLLSVPVRSITRPLVSPTLSARQSSLVQGDFFSSRAVIHGPEINHLGFQGIGIVHIQSGDTDSDETPFEDGVIGVGGEVRGKGGLVQGGEEMDQGFSIPSAVEPSEGSSSGVDFSLSSASTSLSRSQKSGKAGSATGIEQSVEGTAPGDALSLALAVHTDRWIKQSNRRKYMIVELVETEVAYNEHLQDLVLIYLPQLAALPMVSLLQRTVIARNLREIADLHEQIAGRMVEVLAQENMGWEGGEGEEGAQTERLARRLAEVLVNHKSAFSIYDTYCSGSAASNAVIRDLQFHPEWVAFEKRCRQVLTTKPVTTLLDLLSKQKPDFRADLIPPMTLSSRPSRLMLRDLLIKPIQRICQYHLMLGNLVGSASTPAASREEISFHVGPQWDVGVDVDVAFATMREAAQHANEANRKSLIRMRTLNVAARLEEHSCISQEFMKSLGDNILAGSLDILYHSFANPLTPAVKVKYYAVFLYAGYAIMAKVKKENQYQVKHYFPLEMFEMVDVTEGFLPNSIRLVAGDHTFEMAASCAEEKDIWAAALLEAKESSDIPPFELPSSLTSIRTRRSSAVVTTPIGRSSSGLRLSLGPETMGHPGHSGQMSPSLPSSPTMSSVPPSPIRPTSQLLMRRPSPLLRATVDRYIADIISEQLVAARSLVGTQHLFFAPAVTQTPLRSRLSLRDSTVLRRRKSDVDFKFDGGDNSRTSTIGRDSSSKRNSMASSIKRGLSLSSHEGFNALAASHLDQTPTFMSTLRRSGTFSRSTNDQPSDIVASPVTDFGPEKSPAPLQSPIPELGSPEPERTRPSTAEKPKGTFQGFLRRKSSFGDFFTVNARPATVRAISVPTTPQLSDYSPPAGVSRDLQAIAGVYQLGAGITNTGTNSKRGQALLQKRGTIYPRLRAKSYDENALLSATDFQPIVSSRSSPSTSNSGLSSSDHSPLMGHDTLCISSEMGFQPDHHRANSTADLPSDSGNLAPPAPRRRRSIRFLGLTGFTRITKSPAAQKT